MTLIAERTFFYQLAQSGDGTFLNADANLTLHGRKVVRNAPFLNFVIILLLFSS